MGRLRYNRKAGTKSGKANEGIDINYPPRLSVPAVSAGPGICSVCVSLFFVVVFWLTNGRNLRMSADEGISLVGASVVAMGGTPHLDFFSFTGPGEFWALGLIFKTAQSLAVARMYLSVILGAIAGCVAYLLAHLIGVKGSLIAGILYSLALCTSYSLYLTHRWTSNGLAIVGASLLWSCVSNRNGRSDAKGATSGILLGCAALVTPTFLFAGPILGTWHFLAVRADRRVRVVFSGAWLATLAIGFWFVALSGAAGPLRDQLLWAASNYKQANVVPYGWADLSGLDLWTLDVPGVRRYAFTLAPAALPPLFLSLLVGFVLKRRAGKEYAGPAGLCFSFALSALLSCYPRYGAHQLTFIAAIFFVLVVWLLFELLPSCRRSMGILAVLCVAALSARAISLARSERRIIMTAVGIVECRANIAGLASTVVSSVTAGDTMFVYPYLPIIYFITGTKPTTPYLFLQPGMMGAEDEQICLRSLKANPPQWVFWHKFSAEMIMAAWPNSDPLRFSFPEIEDFVRANYGVVDEQVGERSWYRLMRRLPVPTGGGGDGPDRSHR